MSQNHTNDGLPLPDACAHRVLSFLPANQILSTAAVSRRFANVAKAPEVWLDACKSKWPDVRTSAVVARAARTRGPMAFYRRRVSCSREVSVPTVPLCDLEDLIFTVDMEQGATHLCSVAIEARDAMRRDLPDASFGGGLKAGLCLEGLSARVIPWRDEFGEIFPPRLSPGSQLPKPPEHEIQIFITVNVIRKSDGLMSPFVPRHNLRWSGGHSFGRGEEWIDDGDPPRWFAANPNLRGYLPFSNWAPRIHGSDPDALNKGNQLNTCGPDWTSSWVLQALQRKVERLSVERPKVAAKFAVGCPAEFPLGELTPETWTPPADASVVIHPDCVEIRRIHVFFEIFQGDINNHPWCLGVGEEGDLGFDAIHRLLSERLRFA